MHHYCALILQRYEFGLPEEMSFNPSDVDELKDKMLKRLEIPYEQEVVKDQLLDKYNWCKIADNYYTILKNYNV